MQKIKAELNALVVERHAKIEELTRSEDRELVQQIKEKQQELSRAVAAGADKCSGCGELPHGILQERVVDSKVYPFYEIGCLNCNHHTKDLDRKEAVNRWNAGQYDLRD